MSRNRICFYAPYLYPVLAQDTTEFSGGAEVQQAHLARGLLERGFEVTVVTCDFGQPRRTVVSGIRVLRTFPPLAGIPVLRFFHPRLSRIVRALLEADADLYYVRGSGFPAGITYDVARLRKAAFVLGTAHDHDVSERLPLQTNPRDRWWYRRALLGADRVVTQTEFQRRRLMESFGRGAEVVPNLVELPSEPADPGHRGAIVWLATYKPSKRPEWFLELARKLPEQRFVMCGVIPFAPETTAAWETAQAAAQILPNLEVRGFVARDQLGALFRDASLFVHTSPVEGFPNSVLEAWAHALPAITAVDPDGVIAREGLGETAGSLASFVDSVKRWMEDPVRRKEAGQRARAYVASNHSPGALIERFAAVIEDVLGRARAKGTEATHGAEVEAG